jgi:hypothetical protein
MKFVFLILTLSLYATFAMADVFDHPVENAEKLNDFIFKNPHKISGNFKQKRFLADLKIEIQSSGKFSIDTEKGILWRNLSPFQSTTIISGATICTLAGESASIKSSPVLKEFLDVINAIFSQDFDTISKHFHIYFEPGTDNYTVGLRAKSSVMAKSISELTATGAKYMERVSFSNASGDLSILEFSDMTEEAAAFTCGK